MNIGRLLPLNTTPERADGGDVFKSRPNTSADQVIMTLSDDYLVRHCIDHWVVVGPTGLFVVGRSRHDVTSASNDAIALSHQLRSGLADVLSWVPFVSAVVVADEPRHDMGCPVVTMDGLAPVLQHGGRQIGDGALQVLRHHVPGVVQQIEHERGSATSSL